MINGTFTGGQYLEHAQSVDGPQAMTYVGGNIFSADGVKESSQDTWVLSDGQLYALSSDARRNTTLPDGRDLEAHYFTWPEFSDTVSACVGQLERDENAGS